MAGLFRGPVGLGIPQPKPADGCSCGDAQASTRRALISFILVTDLTSDLASRPPGRVHIGIGRAHPYCAHGLVGGARLDALSCWPDDVSRSDDARDHGLRRCTWRACGLAPASTEERDDTTADVPLGEVNVRHGRGVLQSVAKLIGNGLRVAVDLGLEPALAHRGDRAGSYHFLVTVEKGFDIPVLGTGNTTNEGNEREKDCDGQRKTIHLRPPSSASPSGYQNTKPRHIVLMCHRWASCWSLRSRGTRPDSYLSLVRDRASISSSCSADSTARR